MPTQGVITIVFAISGPLAAIARILLTSPDDQTTVTGVIIIAAILLIG